jgi:hypothetical protein
MSKICIMLILLYGASITWAVDEDLIKGNLTFLTNRLNRR